jgi:hypothetical protein
MLSLFCAGLLGPSSADAGRPRDPQRVAERRNAPPIAPEPAAALVFLIGIGAVAWGVKRKRSKSR